MRIFYNQIPASHLQPVKLAQIVPEQMINEVVEIYKDAIPYIRCEIQSTIQHEGGHRADEEGRNEEIIQFYRQPRSRAAQIMPFQQFSNPTRAEPLGEQNEEDCSSLLPEAMSGETISINLNQLFEEAKGAAKLDPGYKRDVRAGTLDPHAQGMYLMQDLPQELALKNTTSAHSYEGFDGTLWVDVRKIAEPYIVQGKGDDERKSHSPDYQSDGAPDYPGVSNIPPTDTAIPATPFVPAAPAKGAR